jgi:ubiquinone/menaquinone biosynthesis C-methylase UbiE
VRALIKLAIYLNVRLSVRTCAVSDCWERVALNSYSFFDCEERRRWQNPETILVDAGLKPSLTFMDIGCGTGFFAIPAAKLVGKKGKVYAVDTNREAISWLKEKARREGLTNLVLREGEAEKTVFCEACADIIFYGIVLHDFASPAKVLANAKKMLKLGGRLIDLDWKKEPMELGPPLRIRFSENEAARLIKAAGFKIEKTGPAGLYHYIIVARP